MNQKKHSWGAVALALALFFPVGIVWLVRKMTGEKTRFEENGRALRIVAGVMFILIPIYFILAATGELRYEDGSSAIGAAWMMAVVLGAGGTFAMVKSNQYIRRGRLYNQHIATLSHQKSIDIAAVAAELKISENTVIGDFQGMIDGGCLPNAHIDLIRRKLVMKEEIRPSRVIICKYCGGKNNVEIGTAAKCDYCNSPLGYS